MVVLAAATDGTPSASAAADATARRVVRRGKVAPFRFFVRWAGSARGMPSRGRATVLLVRASAVAVLSAASSASRSGDVRLRALVRAAQPELSGGRTVDVGDDDLDAQRRGDLSLAAHRLVRLERGSDVLTRVGGARAVEAVAWDQALAEEAVGLDDRLRDVVEDLGADLEAADRRARDDSEASDVAATTERDVDSVGQCRIIAA